MRAAALLACLAVAAAAPAAPPAPASMQTATPAPDARGIAMQLLDLLDAGRFDDAAAPFTPAMRHAVSPALLQQLWSTLPPASERGAPRVVREGALNVVRITLTRGITQWTAMTAVDARGRVAGFRITPLTSSLPVPAPPAGAAYLEREFQVGEGERALPGTLALPRVASGRAVPAVVLVHGSGPQDRNETIVANRPFLDLARGLAERGIATLRYDKRSFARPQDFRGRDSVDDETTDDAVAALRALRGVPGVDPRRIHVLGHSQGGMLAPRIAARAGAGHVAGLVLLAAPARSLLALIPEQVRAFALADGSVSADEQAALDSIAAEIARIRGSSDSTPDDQALGAPLAYWKGFDAIDPVADARALTLPVLLLQGGRDAQVGSADWQRWRTAFAGNARFGFREYPRLNHLGIAGDGPPSPAEYATPGHVDAALLDDVAAWIKAH